MGRGNADETANHPRNGPALSQSSDIQPKGGSPKFGGRRVRVQQQTPGERLKGVGDAYTPGVGPSIMDRRDEKGR